MDTFHSLDGLDFNAVLNQEFHDACGVGFVAELTGKPGRRCVELAIEALKNMSHRGASGADDRTSDGTGLLVDIPRDYFISVLEDELSLRFKGGLLGIGMVFTSNEELPLLQAAFARYALEYGIEFLGTRHVPVNMGILGEIGRATCPSIVQFFFSGSDKKSSDSGLGAASFEQLLYLLRKSVEGAILAAGGSSFICSLSHKTIVYKGMMKPHHLARFYSDLNQLEFRVKIALFHERFSTNTISTWAMAQPFRMLGHNGEINTIKGNRLWMKTREATLSSPLWGESIERLKPIVSSSGSDSYSLDNILEFLTMSGRDMFQSIMTLIPEPFLYDVDMPQALKDFYTYQVSVIEPWDGPAALAFSDGEFAGAKLDRNGLRPLRYTLTKDGLAIMASEAGVVNLDEENVLMHHHMSAGENFLIDLKNGRIIPNEEIVERVTSSGNYSELISRNLHTLTRENEEREFGDFSLPEAGFDKRLRIAFGIDKEDVERLLLPMAETAREAVGSMGDDAPQAILSKQNRKFYEYFKQQFAQITNPPIDSIRERYVMSLNRIIGAETSLLSDSSSFRGAIRIESPVLSPREVALLKGRSDEFPHQVVTAHLPLGADLEERLDEICKECEDAARSGKRFIFLSDEGLDKNLLPIPMLLVVSAVHRHLIDTKVRNNCALLCFTGDALEDHHIACLLSFGASGVYPYMAYEVIRESAVGGEWIEHLNNYRHALEKGLLKIMSKMGISTFASYHGSMLFNSIGVSEQVLSKYFPSVRGALGGLTLEHITMSLVSRHDKAFTLGGTLDEIGRFRFRKDGEQHGFSPSVFKTIQNTAMAKGLKFDDDRTAPVYIRDLFDVRRTTSVNDPSTCEPNEDIIKRFGLGAISFGAISEEVHRTLARAAALLGMRSNTGEGGEQKDRYNHSNPDKSENCYTKQIASGRFGVTPHYLSAAREIQIKAGQGAKPGEGGQLPGEKVTLSIANERNTTPGVPLISPPPHHDIYSIEDLAQLIYDLRQINPRASICVKLVSQYGIGIIAAGVVKAGADVILVSGNDGGTGASPLGSIKHTGLPWELGLSEVHRTLVANGLRNRVTLRVDGGLKTGKDIVVAALLGAEEFDFGTTALVALGCVMARQCHSNTCPVGIATQDKELRKRFKGKPDHLGAYIRAVAEQVRILLGELGFYSLDEIVGRNDLLIENPEFKEFVSSKNIDLRELLKGDGRLSYYIDTKVKYKPAEDKGQYHIGEGIIEEVRPAIMSHGRAIINRNVKNTDRAIGTRLSGLLAFLYGSGEFKGHIQYRMSGGAGQSLGAFLTDNIELRHSGVANDYVGKGMSGGLITIRFPRNVRLSLKGNTIIGNVALYGATGGELFVAGHAGERFAVRNSGAAAVVEGVGNHCCEYMTRGMVIVLGEVGKNFGAGMTGGVAYLYDNPENVAKHLNDEYVKTAAMEEVDEELVFKYLVNHKFHTDSTVAGEVLDDWKNLKQRFIKIVPKAMDLVDFNKIYEEQYKNRLLEVFNE